MGFPGGSEGKESVCNAGDLGWEDSPGGGHGNPLQYSCLENPHGQRSLAGYSPWGGRESNGTERLSTAHVGCQTDVCFKHQLFFMTAHMTGGSKKPPNHICQLQSLKLSPTNKRYQAWVFP